MHHKQCVWVKRCPRPRCPLASAANAWLVLQLVFRCAAYRYLAEIVTGKKYDQKANYYYSLVRRGCTYPLAGGLAHLR